MVVLQNLRCAWRMRRFGRLLVSVITQEWYNVTSKFCFLFLASVRHGHGVLHSMSETSWQFIRMKTLQYNIRDLSRIALLL
jgi:hypothetical protein